MCQMCQFSETRGLAWDRCQKGDGITDSGIEACIASEERAQVVVAPSFARVSRSCEFDVSGIVILTRSASEEESGRNPFPRLRFGLV